MVFPIEDALDALRDEQWGKRVFYRVVLSIEPRWLFRDKESGLDVRSGHSRPT